MKRGERWCLIKQPRNELRDYLLRIVNGHGGRPYRKDRGDWHVELGIGRDSMNIDVFAQSLARRMLEQYQKRYT